MAGPQSTQRGLMYDHTDLRGPWQRTGRPVVFHHGIGTNREIWSRWLPIVAPQHECIRFDLRGYGGSVVPSTDHRWSIDELVDDVMAIAATADAPKVHLVGESLGGTVVLAAAIRHPDKVASVTISNAAYKGMGIGHVAGWRDEIRRSGMKAWSAGMMEKRFAPDIPRDAALAWFASEQDKAKEHVTIGLGEMLAASDLTAELPKLKAPLLILMPDSSPFVPARMGLELAEMVPGAELAVFPGVRHGLPFSHAVTCARRLRSFLAKVEAGEAGRARFATSG